MRRLALTVLLLLPCAPVAWAEDLASPCGRLGAPARRDAVRAAVAALPEADVEGAVTLARALGASGGAAATAGLSDLLRFEDERVREAVLRAAGRIGLRSEPLAVVARESLDALNPRLRRVAVYALGRIGDGRDVKALLDLAADLRDRRLQRAAHEALVALSGRDLPRDASRRAVWWEMLSADAARSVPKALEALQNGADPELLAVHRSLLRQLGWAALPEAVESTARWLHGPERRLQEEACWLVAHLRLADLADALASARRFDVKGEIEEASRGALHALGLPVE